MNDPRPAYIACSAGSNALKRVMDDERPRRSKKALRRTLFPRQPPGDARKVRSTPPGGNRRVIRAGSSVRFSPHLGVPTIRGRM